LIKPINSQCLQARRLPLHVQPFVLACLRACAGSAAVSADALLASDFFSPAVRQAASLLNGIHGAMPTGM